VERSHVRHVSATCSEVRAISFELAEARPVPDDGMRCPETRSTSKEIYIVAINATTHILSTFGHEQVIWGELLPACCAPANYKRL
jgi:hypothetical protein